MTKLDWITIWAVLAVVVVVIITSTRYRVQQRAHQLAREMMQREAVIAGHAEWRPGTNGEPVFHWRACP